MLKINPAVSLAIVLFFVVDSYLAATLLGRSFVLINSKQNNGIPFRRLRRSSPSQAIIETFHVKSKITSRYSRVTVTSVVRNAASSAQEVSVEIRLPKSAFISNFSMEINSVTYVSVVKEKAEAKRQYQQAVSQGHSAGLVTAKVRESQTFDVSVNVAAGGAVTFKLYYQELLERKLGVYNHVIYANPGQVVKDLKVEVHISEPSGIQMLKIHPPSSGENEGELQPDMLDGQDGITLRRSQSQAFVVYEPSLEKQRLLRQSDPKFTVKYDVTREELGGEIIIKDGYFVHFLAPTNLPVIPKNLVFVIDRSGSMHGSKIEQTKSALLTILDDLGDHDKFNIITFSSESQMWQRNEMFDVTPTNIERAKSFVRDITASGGTNLRDATLQGVSLLETITNNLANTLERASMIILLTDGQPTSGVTNLQTIRKDVKNRINGRYSLFCLGFGHDVDHNFLNQLASENKGISRKIYADSDASLQLQGFYKEVASPLLTHVIIQYQNKTVKKLTSTEFDTFFDGTELLVAGKFKRKKKVESAPQIGDFWGVSRGICTTGSIELISKGREFEPTFADEGFDMERLWAYLTIKDLLKRKVPLQDIDNEKAKARNIDKKVIRLSLKYNFVTTLTSMVVTKPNNLTSVTSEPREETVAYDSMVPQSMPQTSMSHHALVPQMSRLRTSSRTYNSPSFTSRFGSSRSRSFRYSSPQLHARILGTRNSNSFGWMFPSTTTTPPRTTSTATTTTTTITTTTTTPTTTTTETTQVAYTKSIPNNPLTLESSCGETITLRDSVNITSPRFPGLYPADTQCVWTINLDSDIVDEVNNKIRITFPKMDLEESCDNDRIVIYTDFDQNFPSTTSTETYCGYDNQNIYLDAVKNFVLLFQSDNIVQGRGFLAHFQILPVV